MSVRPAEEPSARRDADVALGPCGAADGHRGRRGWWTAVVLLAALGTAIAPAAAGPDARPAAPSDSALTRRVAEGPFAGLTVTVAKTGGLGNEVVEVSWSGARPTEPDPGLPHRHFLQVMQCWGGPDGPRREQCQFGANPFNPLVSFTTGTRAVRGPGGPGGAALPVDPAEGLSAVDPGNPDAPAHVDFAPVGAAVVDGVGGFRTFFDYQGTNEIAYAPTRADGTGTSFFEMQTAAQAPGLGCGAAPDGKTTGCWLVVVPRGDVEVDGTRRAPGVGPVSDQRLASSPLSASNWAHRMTFPLGFTALRPPCPLESGQVPVVAHESAIELLTAWQPALCQATGRAFIVSQTNDPSVLAGGIDPATVTLAAHPPSTGQAPASAALLHAPVALSGIGIGYLMETQVHPDDPPEVRRRAGQRLTGLRLTPRLVAKLLTQSYRLATHDRAAVAANPARLEEDPEFRRLNPTLEGLSQPTNGISGILTPIGRSDAATAVWAWIGRDPQARAFLAGEPDPDGMRVNPAYRSMDTRIDDFPKLDQTCRPGAADDAESSRPRPLCIADSHPYAADMHAAALAASRGDSLARTRWSPGGRTQPPGYRQVDRQPVGSRALMVIADTATAARYHLPMAALRNADGEFVAPEAPGLLAAAGEPGAYPLPVLTHALVAPGASAPTRAGVAALARMAAGRRPSIGSAVQALPPGYVCLPAGLAAEALELARVMSRPQARAESRPRSRPAARSGAPEKPVAIDPRPPAAPSPRTVPGRSTADPGGDTAGSPVAPGPTRGDLTPANAPRVPSQDLPPEPAAAANDRPAGSRPAVGALVLLAGLLTVVVRAARARFR